MSPQAKATRIFEAHSPASYAESKPICETYDLDEGSCRREHGNENDSGDENRGKNSQRTVPFHTFVSTSPDKDNPDRISANETKSSSMDTSFLTFRLKYLIVHVAIMLADGLQGTHIYVLYEGYGYSVASLYCLGFVSGALTSPFTGPFVDRAGRRTSAIIYCILEILINMLEQRNSFTGLIISRVIGGITTNLLFTVFESWLVTEHRNHGFSVESLEVILRDSVICSNLSAIVSGIMAHYLAHFLGPVGPFEGAVGCTWMALVLVSACWGENYGSVDPGAKTVQKYMSDAFETILSDSKISRIGIIQGLSEGALQTFVFLWAPALRYFATLVPTSNSVAVLGIDEAGEPSFGLIFGAFMACGAIGGLCEPTGRKLISKLLSSDEVPPPPEQPPLENVFVAFQEIIDDTSSSLHSNCTIDTCDTGSIGGTSTSSSDDEQIKNTAGVQLLSALCYALCSCFLATPILVSNDVNAFSKCLVSFLAYEFVIGLYLPCEGVIRTIYMPNDSICSLMTMLRVIVNVSVAIGVISTKYISLNCAFAGCSGALAVATFLQLSLVQKEDWNILKTKLAMVRRGFQSKVDVSSDMGSICCVPSTPATTRSSLTPVDLSTITSETDITTTLRRRKVPQR